MCQKYGETFSLLPIQLIPYFQYTASAVIGALFLGLGYWQMGQAGFRGAEVSVHPDSDLTPWLVACWLMVVVAGLRRGHADLRRLYDLSSIKTSQRVVPWQEFADYFLVFGIASEVQWGPLLQALLYRYSHKTKQFLFGSPSQYRLSRH